MANGVMGVFNGLLTHLTLEPIDSDNWNFKLHSKLSVALFFTASAASFLNSYFGDPIKCLNAGDNKDEFESICWLHGSYHIDNFELAKDINGGENCFKPSPDQILSNGNLPGGKTTNSPHTHYYIWVTWMLLLNGALFIIPNVLWRRLEGGNMREFKLENEETTEMEVATRFTSSTPKAKNSYFRKFIYMECLNLGVVILNFCIIDTFLSEQFSGYGMDAIKYSTGAGVKTEWQGKSRTYQEILNPMCTVFPTIVNCPPKIPSASQGAIDSKSILCILSQNLVNQYIYMILWWWFMVLFLSNGLMVIYRIVTIVNVGNARNTVVRYLMKTTSNVHPTMMATEESEEFRNNLQIGEWFLLSRIGKNCKPHFFRSFLEYVMNLRKAENNGIPSQNQNNDDQQQNFAVTSSQRSMGDPQPQAITYQQLQSTAEERERLAITYEQ